MYELGLFDVLQLVFASWLTGLFTVLSPAVMMACMRCVASRYDG